MNGGVQPDHTHQHPLDVCGAFGLLTKTGKILRYLRHSPNFLLDRYDVESSPLTLSGVVSLFSQSTAIVVMMACLFVVFDGKRIASGMRSRPPVLRERPYQCYVLDVERPASEYAFQ